MVSEKGEDAVRKKTQSKREEIVAIARAAFLDGGYAATSMATIAALVGGSKGTLYGYFSSKEELFGAVVRDVSEEHGLPVLALLDDPQADLAETIFALARALTRFFVMPEAIAHYRLAVGEAGRFPKLGQIFFEQGQKEGEGMVTAWLEERIARGELAARPPRLLAQQFVALCRAGPWNALLMGAPEQPGEAQLEELATLAARTFLAAHALPHPE